MAKGIDELNRIRQLRLLNDGVYVDSVNGVAGTVYPIGTPGRPVSNLTDAIAICVARGIRTILLVNPADNFVAPADMQGYRIIGWGKTDANMASGFNFGGFNFNDSQFENVRLQGVAFGIIAIQGCSLGNTTLRGDTVIQDSTLWGTLTIYARTWFTNVRFAQGPLTFADFTNGIGVNHYWTDVSGDLTIMNMAGGETLYIYGQALRLEIQGDVTSGEFNLYGDVRVENLSLAVPPALLIRDYTSQVHVYRTTIDLNQIAGSYDLWKAYQDATVEKLIIRMSGGAIGGALTSISIQTDDATPQVFVSAAQGAVANLTNEEQLTWVGACMLDGGTTAKIQLTINGGAAGVARICDVIVHWRGTGVASKFLV